MPSTIGKITGQMLENDLQRDGEDLYFDNDLLYLDVNLRTIGIKNTSPFRTLQVNGTTRTTNLEIDNQFSVDGFTFAINTISNDDTIYLSSDNNFIYAGAVGTDDIVIDNNTIRSTRSNADIDLTPHGSGQINLNSNVEVNASLHATGNVSFDGTVIFGNADTDNITFAADVASNINPDLTSTYELGGLGKRWNHLYTNLVNGTVYNISGGAFVEGIDLNLRQGNTYYVAVNGGSSNYGDHIQDPFDKVEDALAVASAGDTVIIFPGTYFETLPLVVPAGVTVRGFGIRAVTIKPDTASGGQDVFHLNGECTIEDLSVADFYYDSLNDTGYGFAFAPGFSVTSRSPYVRNISVLTKGSVTSVGDPLGYDEGDAGRGAKVDGSLATSSSVEASMLFHSVTFITPGQRALVMTNGVRIEWLNSFIYFASEGLYAENGVLGFANLGLRFGAEIRSIASANVYGNIGAKADGNSTLMYLINHNWGYIGAGKDSQNDPSLVIEANQAIELNDGRIYYQSMDQEGDFRVGTIFKVDSNTGKITITTETFTSTSITITDGTNVTYIDEDEIDTGNIKISGNTIESLSGGIDFLAANNTINLAANLIVNQSLTTNNLTVKSHITFGNASTDTVAHTAKATNDLIPYIDSVAYKLGSTSNRWRTLNAAAMTFDNILINTNFIATTLSNSDLELNANGTGSVKFESLNFKNSTISTFNSNQNINISPNGSGKIKLDADTSVTGNLGITGNALVQGNVQIGDIYLDSINPVGKIGSDILPQVTSVYTIGSPSLRWANTYIDKLVTDQIEIDNSYIQITNTNSDLELKANGTGNVVFENVAVNNNQISSFNTNQNLNLTTNGSGVIISDANTNLTGNLTTTGTSTFNSNVTFNTSYTTSFPSSINSDLVPSSNATRDLGSNTNRWRTAYMAKLLLDGIVIDTNFIELTDSNANLELRANGTGTVKIDSLGFINNTISSNVTNTDIQINPNGTGIIQLLKDTVISGSVGSTPYSYTFNAGVNSNILPSITNQYSLGSGSTRWRDFYTNSLWIDGINIDTNVIQITESNANLEFRANGTGSVQIDLLNFKSNTISSNTTNSNININPNGSGKVQLQKNTIVTGSLTSDSATISSNTTLGNDSSDSINPIGRIINGLIPQNTSLYSLGTSSLRWNSYLDQLWVDGINIDTNVIQSTESNANLEFRANGTGSVQINTLNFRSNSITSNVTNTDIQINPNGTGVIQLLKDTNLTGNLTASGNATVGGNVQIGDVYLDSINPVGRIGTGLIPATTAAYDIGSDLYRWRTYNLSKLVLDDIVIDTNVIESTLSNQNLELRANGTGSVRIDTLDLKSNTIISNTTNTDIEITPNGTGVVQLGKNTIVTGTLTVSSNTILNGNLVIGDSTSDTVTVVSRFISDLIPNSSAVYNIGSDALRWRNIYSSALFVDDIAIDTNVIQSTLSNQNLELRANGTGSIQIATLNFKSNTISSNTTNANINITPNGTGTIQLQKDTVVSGSLTVGGNIILSNVSLGDSDTDTINTIGSFINDVVPSQTNTYTVGSTSLRWNGYFDQLWVDFINIDTNVIQSTESNANLELRASGSGSITIDLLNIKNNSIISNTTDTNIIFDPDGTGKIQLKKNTAVTGTLQVYNDATLAGNVQFGDEAADFTYFPASFITDILPADNNAYDLGSDSGRWRTFYLNKLIIDDIEIDTNVIQSTLSNQNLELRTLGTGLVIVDELNFKNNTISNNLATITAGIDLVTRSANIATVYTFTPHGFVPGQVVDVNVPFAFIHNGSFSQSSATLLSGTTGNTLVYANTGGNLGLTSVLGASATYSYYNDINITPNGSGTIQLQKDTVVSGSLTVGGNIILSGVSLGNESTDTINTTGSFINNLVPLTTNTYTVGTSSLRWNGYFNQLWVDGINIDTNIIQSTESNANLELRTNGTGSVQIDTLNFKSNTIISNTTNSDINFTPNGTGKIKLQKDTAVTGNLDVTGNATVGGNVQIGDVILDNINTVGRIASNIVPQTDNVYTLGTISRTWANAWLDQAIINDITIDTNLIKTTVSNSDLELRANGTGVIKISDSAVFNQNFSVSGTSNLQNTDVNGTLSLVGNLVLNVSLTADEFSTGDILINDNYITTTLSNSNLELRASSSGGVIVDNFLKFTNNVLSNVNTTGTESERSIIFSPSASRIAKFNNSTAVQIPIGNNTNRTLANTGEIRFNNSSSTYEGFVTGGTKSLYALYDIDRNTGITAELTPGTNDDTIRMFAGGVTVADITASRVNAIRLGVDEVYINSNQIGTANTNADLELERSGTGIVNIKDSISITNNTITNLTSGAATQITPSSTGYVRFADTTALRIPAGTTAEQQASMPVGATRWNTTTNELESYDGSTWVASSGSGSTVTAAVMEELTSFYALIVG